MIDTIHETGAGECRTSSGLDSKSPECFFFGLKTDACFASISTMSINAERKSRYCFNENFDDCPMFLSKVLRTC